MTEHALVPHPHGAPVVERLGVFASAELVGGSILQLAYRLRGDSSQLLVPARAQSQRMDRLWERTCFEAFIAPANRERYFEINVSPSTEWAAYAFERYRHGMQPLALARPPRVGVTDEAGELRVTASVDLSGLDDAPLPWRASLTAVVADATGDKSYWALEHPGAEPDFHAAVGFVLRLEGTVR